jgi:SAM-dependent methyltransferase/anti-sigma regulatory factor (Ser/Thr protein kinase)
VTQRSAVIAPRWTQAQLLELARAVRAQTQADYLDRWLREHGTAEEQDFFRVPNPRPAAAPAAWTDLPMTDVLQAAGQGMSDVEPTRIVVPEADGTLVTAQPLAELRRVRELAAAAGLNNGFDHRGTRLALRQVTVSTGATLQIVLPEAWGDLASADAQGAELAQALEALGRENPAYLTSLAARREPFVILPAYFLERTMDGALHRRAAGDHVGNGLITIDPDEFDRLPKPLRIVLLVHEGRHEATGRGWEAEGEFLSRDVEVLAHLLGSDPRGVGITDVSAFADRGFVDRVERGARLNHLLEILSSPRVIGEAEQDAIEALAQLVRDDPTWLPALMDRMAGTSRRLRIRGVEALARHGALWQPLLGVLGDRRSGDEVRSDAALAIQLLLRRHAGILPTSEQFDELVAALRRAHAGRRRDTAPVLGALTQALVNHRALTGPLITALSMDTDEPVRADLIALLGDLLHYPHAPISPEQLRLLVPRSAAERSLLFNEVLEPLSFKHPELFTDDVIRELENAYGDAPEFKYLLFYAGDPSHARDSAWLSANFPHQAAFRSVVGPGKKRVLVARHTVGLGSELIRNAILLQALLDANPELEIVVYTEREYLYDHPRVQMRPLGTLQEIPETETFDLMLLDKPHEPHAVALPAALQAQLDWVPALLFTRAVIEPEPVTLRLPGTQERRTVELPSIYEGHNYYLHLFRLCAELGLRFRQGAQPPAAPLLLGDDGYAPADRYWTETVQAANRGQRPVVVFNPFGGTLENKGYPRTPAGQAALAQALEELVRQGAFVVVLPNREEWGTVARAEEIVRSLPSEVQQHLLVAPEPQADPRLYNHLVSRADLVVTVEGGLMHYAYHLGKPYRVLQMPGSGSISIWHPPGAAGQGVIQSLDRLELPPEIQPPPSGGSVPAATDDLHGPGGMAADQEMDTDLESLLGYGEEILAELAGQPEGPERQRLLEKLQERVEAIREYLTTRAADGERRQHAWRLHEFNEALSRLGTGQVPETHQTVNDRLRAALDRLRDPRRDQPAAITILSLTREAGLDQSTFHIYRGRGQIDDALVEALRISRRTPMTARILGALQWVDDLSHAGIARAARVHPNTVSLQRRRNAEVQAAYAEAARRLGISKTGEPAAPEPPVAAAPAATPRVAVLTPEEGVARLRAMIEEMAQAAGDDEAPLRITVIIDGSRPLRRLQERFMAAMTQALQVPGWRVWSPETAWPGPGARRTIFVNTITGWVGSGPHREAKADPGHRTIAVRLALLREAERLPGEVLTHADAVIGFDRGETWQTGRLAALWRKAGSAPFSGNVGPEVIAMVDPRPQDIEALLLGDSSARAQARSRLQALGHDRVIVVERERADEQIDEVVAYAREAGIEGEDLEQMRLIARELTWNIIDHANAQGVVLLRRTRSDAGTLGIELIAWDVGEGIADIPGTIRKARTDVLALHGRGLFMSAALAVEGGRGTFDIDSAGGWFACLPSEGENPLTVVRRGESRIPRGTRITIRRFSPAPDGEVFGLSSREPSDEVRRFYTQPPQQAEREQAIQALLPPVVEDPAEMAHAIAVRFGDDWQHALAMTGPHLINRARRPFIDEALAAGVSIAAIAQLLQYRAPGGNVTIETFPEPFRALVLRHNRGSRNFSKNLDLLWPSYHERHPEVPQPAALAEIRSTALGALPAEARHRLRAVPPGDDGEFIRVFLKETEPPHSSTYLSPDRDMMIRETLVPLPDGWQAGGLKPNQVALTVDPVDGYFHLWLTDKDLIRQLPPDFTTVKGRVALGTASFRDDSEDPTAIAVAELQVWPRAARLKEPLRSRLSNLEPALEQAFRAWARQRGRTVIRARPGYWLFDHTQLPIARGTVDRLNRLYASQGYRLTLQGREWWWEWAEAPDPQEERAGGAEPAGTAPERFSADEHREMAAAFLRGAAGSDAAARAQAIRGLTLTLERRIAAQDAEGVGVLLAEVVRMLADLELRERDAAARASEGLADVLRQLAAQAPAGRVWVARGVARALGALIRIERQRSAGLIIDGDERGLDVEAWGSGVYESTEGERVMLSRVIRVDDAVFVDSPVWSELQRLAPGLARALDPFCLRVRTLPATHLNRRDQVAFTCTTMGSADRVDPTGAWVLDLGAGEGLQSLRLVHKGAAGAILVENEAELAADAEGNFADSGLGGRAHLIAEDLRYPAQVAARILEHLPADADLVVVSNLGGSWPYVYTATNQEAVRVVERLEQARRQRGDTGAIRAFIAGGYNTVRHRQELEQDQRRLREDLGLSAPQLARYRREDGEVMNVTAFSVVPEPSPAKLAGLLGPAERERRHWPGATPPAQAGPRRTVIRLRHHGQVLDVLRWRRNATGRPVRVVVNFDPHEDVGDWRHRLLPAEHEARWARTALEKDLTEYYVQIPPDEPELRHQATRIWTIRRGWFGPHVVELQGEERDRAFQSLAGADAMLTVDADAYSLQEGGVARYHTAPTPQAFTAQSEPVAAFVRRYGCQLLGPITLAESLDDPLYPRWVGEGVDEGYLERLERFWAGFGVSADPVAAEQSEEAVVDYLARIAGGRPTNATPDEVLAMARWVQADPVRARSVAQALFAMPVPLQGWEIASKLREIVFGLDVASTEAALPAWATRRVEVDFVPTQPETVRHIAKVLSLGPDDHFQDLGAGYGELLLLLAMLTEARFTGFEVVAERARVGQAAADRLAPQRVMLKQKDCAKLTLEDLGDGTVFYLYIPFHADTSRHVARLLGRLAERRYIRAVSIGDLHRIPNRFLRDQASLRIALVHDGPGQPFVIFESAHVPRPVPRSSDAPSGELGHDKGLTGVTDCSFCGWYPEAVGRYQQEVLERMEPAIQTAERAVADGAEPLAAVAHAVRTIREALRLDEVPEDLKSPVLLTERQRAASEWAEEWRTLARSSFEGTPRRRILLGLAEQIQRLEPALPLPRRPSRIHPRAAEFWQERTREGSSRYGWASILDQVRGVLDELDRGGKLGPNILELGPSSTLDVTGALAEQGHLVVGVDIGIDQAVLRPSDRALILKGDLHELSSVLEQPSVRALLGSAPAFDALVASDVLAYIDRQALEDAVAYLKPGGRLISAHHLHDIYAIGAIAQYHPERVRSNDEVLAFLEFGLGLEVEDIRGPDPAASMADTRQIIVARKPLPQREVFRMQIRASLERIRDPYRYETSSPPDLSRLSGAEVEEALIRRMERGLLEASHLEWFLFGLAHGTLPVEQFLADPLLATDIPDPVPADGSWLPPHLTEEAVDSAALEPPVRQLLHAFQRTLREQQFPHPVFLIGGRVRGTEPSAGDDDVDGTLSRFVARQDPGAYLALRAALRDRLQEELGVPASKLSDVLYNFDFGIQAIEETIRRHGRAFRITQERTFVISEARSSPAVADRTDELLETVLARFLDEPETLPGTSVPGTSGTGSTAEVPVAESEPSVAYIDPARLDGFDVSTHESLEQFRDNVTAIMGALADVTPSLAPESSRILNVGSGVRPLALPRALNIDAEADAGRGPAEETGAAFEAVSLMGMAQRVRAGEVEPFVVVVTNRMGDHLRVYERQHHHSPVDFWGDAWTCVAPGGWLVVIEPSTPTLPRYAGSIRRVFEEVRQAIGPHPIGAIRIVNREPTLEGASAFVLQKPDGTSAPGRGHDGSPEAAAPTLWRAGWSSADIRPYPGAIEAGLEHAVIFVRPDGRLILVVDHEVTITPFLAWLVRTGRLPPGWRLVRFDGHPDMDAPLSVRQGTQRFGRPGPLADARRSLEQFHEEALREYKDGGFVVPFQMERGLRQSLWVRPDGSVTALTLVTDGEGHWQAVEETPVGEIETAVPPHAELAFCDLDILRSALVRGDRALADRLFAAMVRTAAAAEVVTIATSPGYIAQTDAQPLARRLVEALDIPAAAPPGQEGGTRQGTGEPENAPRSPGAREGQVTQEVADEALRRASQRLELIKTEPLDERPIRHGILAEPYVRSAMAIKQVVNPQNKPIVALYGGAGFDISSFLLSLNAQEGYFVSEQYGITAGDLAFFFKDWRKYTAALSPDSREAWFGVGRRYVGAKFLHGSTSDAEWRGNAHRELLILSNELLGLGVDLSRVRVDSYQGHPRIRFPWRYVGSSQMEYAITFVEGDITLPEAYPKLIDQLLERGIDCYFQRASGTIPWAYTEPENFVLHLYRAMRPGGFFVTSDYAGKSAVTMDDEGLVVDRSARFPIALPEILMPHQDILEAAALELQVPTVMRLLQLSPQEAASRAEAFYQWHLRLRQRVPEASPQAAIDLLNTASPAELDHLLRGISPDRKKRAGLVRRIMNQRPYTAFGDLQKVPMLNAEQRNAIARALRHVATTGWPQGNGAVRAIEETEREP